MGRKFKGILLTLFFSPFPLRERTKVRGSVNFFHPHLYPPPSMGRKFKGILLTLCYLSSPPAGEG
jgi:hypothetical protein